MSEALEQFSSTRKCAWCGKLITVLWPQQWAYKRGTPGHEKYYLCSWKCLRLFDKAKEEKERRHMGAPRIISDEQEKEAVRIALEGGDPLRYLEECGSNIPPQTWYRIKQKLKDADPETYEKLPKRIQRKDTVKKQVETPEGEYSAAGAMEGMKNAADEFFGKCKDMGLRIETPENPKVPKIYTPVRFDGKEVCGLKGDYGRYSVYELNGVQYLNFVSNNGEELDMPVQAWRDFLKDLRKCAGIMGVEL